MQKKDFFDIKFFKIQIKISNILNPYKIIQYTIFALKQDKIYDNFIMQTIRRVYPKITVILYDYLVLNNS